LDICAEVNLFEADYFISIHSNANVDGDNVNYPLIIHSGYDGAGFRDERNMALHTWPRLFEAFGNDKDHKNIEQGFDYNSPITPEVVCNDIISQLDLYQMYDPESKDYVVSVKAFYTAAAKEELDYAGVLIYAFQDNLEHSIFKLGDIIIGYDGKKVKNMADLNAAFRINKYGSVKLLRLIDGNLKEIVLPQIKDTDVVGFGDLTE
jgi:hypothetical protein